MGKRGKECPFRSGLSMESVPWHEEVKDFAVALLGPQITLNYIIFDVKLRSEVLPEYGVACEHEHSCSVLLARLELRL